jgi:hypothetical protein
MRRAPHDGKKPRRLQLKATSLSWPQSPQRRRRKPWARAALEEGVELVFDEARQLGSGVGLGVGDEAGRMLLHQAVQRGLLRAMPLEVDRGAVRRPLGRSADGLHARLLRW